MLDGFMIWGCAKALYFKLLPYVAGAIGICPF